MAIIYRYVHIPREDGTLRKAPFIPINVTNRFGQSMRLVALVDSGADNTVVPYQLAKLLGLKISKDTITTGGIGGSAEVCRSRMRFRLASGRERYNLDVPCLILMNDDDVPLLLGRNGFFENFHITFRQDKEKIVLKKIEPKALY